MPTIALGPILYARTATQASLWSFGIGVLVDGASATELEAARLAIDGAEPVAPAYLHEFRVQDIGRQRVFVRWDVELPRTAEARRVEYRVEIPGTAPIAVDSVRVPGSAELPSIGFFSCNGVSSSKLWHRLPRPFERWEELAQTQANGALDLLIGGGDQIYADSIWDLPGLRPFVECDWQKKVGGTETTAALAAEVLAGYVDLYVERWKQPHMSFVLARVPTLFTWDDHDVFDGWGSHEKLQQTPVFKAIFAQARRAFVAFQLGGLTDARPAGAELLRTFRFAGGPNGRDVVDIVLPDTRSHRETNQVLGEAQWAELDRWFVEREADRKELGYRHVLFVSPVPVVYLRFSGIVESGGWIANLRDDLVDQWESRHHRGERARLIMTLLEHQARSRSAVTILSGDVHVGARAEIRSRNPRHALLGQPEVVINQVTSSGIVHPPPSRLEHRGMLALSSSKPDDIGQGVETVSIPIGEEDHLLARNYLFIEFDEPKDDRKQRCRMWIEYRAGDLSPRTKIVVETSSG